MPFLTQHLTDQTGDVRVLADVIAVSRAHHTTVVLTM
jgi:hypothetical protein